MVSPKNLLQMSNGFYCPLMSSYIHIPCKVEGLPYVHKMTCVLESSSQISIGTFQVLVCHCCFIGVKMLFFLLLLCKGTFNVKVMPFPSQNAFPKFTLTIKFQLPFNSSSPFVLFPFLFHFTYTYW